VAPRTGDKRLLAFPARTTSTGLCLALVVAGLLLSGCGGGSVDPESAGAGDASGAAAQKEVAAVPEGSGSQGRAAGKRQAGTSPKTTAAPQAEDPAAHLGQKHGPRIAQPKGPREQAPTAAERAELTVADMSLTSPSLPTGSGEAAPLLSAYTCDGKDSWPALSWSGVPSGTAELILYAMNVAPVEGKLFVDWAVAGLDPALTGIEAGKLPKGAVAGTNSFAKQGYEICPEGSEIYIFAIYALPRALSPRRGFDARELRRQILGLSGHAGLLPVTYTRG
jgi:phosphatidylethanolamine-binding protein (PEBP) family uncharacterized protein